MRDCGRGTADSIAACRQLLRRRRLYAPEPCRWQSVFLNGAALGGAGAGVSGPINRGLCLPSGTQQHKTSVAPHAK